MICLNRGEIEKSVLTLSRKSSKVSGHLRGTAVQQLSGDVCDARRYIDVGSGHYSRPGFVSALMYLYATSGQESVYSKCFRACPYIIKGNVRIPPLIFLTF
jgi:hypothetical protein